jgi:hypothetical protein
VSHAKLFSPSKAEGWFACAGRSVMEAAFPDKGSEYSRDGTARHAVVADCLKVGGNCSDLVGYYVDVASGEIMMPNVGDDVSKHVQYVEDWVEEDQDYVDTVRKLAEGGDLHVEQRVDFRRFIECTADDDGFGTGDSIILKPLPDTKYELIVIDRKTGYHEVPVERNKQLLLYALGAYDEHNLVYDISRVRLIIHQRRAREWDCSVEDLLAFGQEARSRAISVVNAVAMHGQVHPAEWSATFLNQQPSEDACRYCKAMATCPSMQKFVTDTVDADFEDMATGDVEFNLEEGSAENLAKAMAACGLLEDFTKAVRAEVERRLLAGKPIPGFKLVLGKAGSRAWKDAEAIEATLKGMRLKVEEMYDLKVISPTSAEKLTKGDKPAIGPKQWTKLQAHIGRAEPKPSVAAAADKRDAWVPPNVADDFAPVAAEATDLA